MAPPGHPAWCCSRRGLTASVRTPGGLSVLEVASFGFAIVPIGMLCSQYLFFLSKPRAAVTGAVAGACTSAVVTAVLVQGRGSDPRVMGPPGRHHRLRPDHRPGVLPGPVRRRGVLLWLVLSPRTPAGRSPEVQAAPNLSRPAPDGPSGYTSPTELNESWDPSDDEKRPEERREVNWNWHGRQSWGRRAVAAFPIVGILLAGALFVHTTASAQGAIDQVQSVVGTGGATLLSSAPPTAPGPTADGAQLSDYQNVTFSQPSGPSAPIQGSTSLALPPYVGWEANGSAGASNGLASVSGGLLHVAVRQATTDFRGWFLTTTGTTPASCVLQFSAASPPPVTAASPRPSASWSWPCRPSNTVTTGDINYVFVAENVASDGHRNLTVGYSQGHLSHATEHILKQVPWTPGPLQVAIQTNGDNKLSVWVDGSLFYYAYILQLGITPPFQPYLEVQARQTPYTVAYDGYSSVCDPDVAVTGLPEGTVATWTGANRWPATVRRPFPPPSTRRPWSGS